MVSQWLIEPRLESDLSRLTPIARWSSLEIVERHNLTGSWSLVGSYDDLAVLRDDGLGVVISRDGVPVMSGPVTSITVGSKESTITGLSDFSVLDERIVFPNPASNWASQTVNSHDVRFGDAETVLLGYVKDNAGSTAYAGSGTFSDRRTGLLTVPVSLGRGASVKHSGRFGKLSLLVANIAEAGGLQVDVIHDESSGAHRLVTVSEVVDRRSEVRFGTPDVLANGLIDDDWSYTIERSAITDAMVAGGGTGIARSSAYAHDTAAIAAWGHVIESFIDQRQSSDATELVNAATDALADNSAPVEVSLTVHALDPEVTLGMGDVVGVNLRGRDLPARLRERTTTVTVGNDQTEQVQIVVGSRWASKRLTLSQKKILDAQKRLTKLEAQ